MTTIAQTTEAWIPQAPITGLPRFLSYMRYPVFSREWLFARTKLFGACFLLYIAASGVGLALYSGKWLLALSASALQWLAFMAAIALGPWLGVRVREKNQSPMETRSGLLTATLCGMLYGLMIDSGVKLVLSNYVSNALDLSRAAGIRLMFSSPFTGAEKLAIPLSSGYALLATLLVIGMMFVLYAFYAGRFAILSYDAEIRHAEQLKRRQEWETLKQQKLTVDQQLAILQAQIEPHFLFNTLSSVRALVKQDAERAAAMLDGLADYLRITLPKLRTTDAVASLGEQLDICQRYLQLMQLRMGERFSYVIDVPDVLRQLQVPPLLLLPLVENAIKHGVEPKPGNVSVTIMARQQDNNLLIDVSDDGAGLNVGMHAALNSPQSGQGVGLDNVRRQLQLRFGERATLDISGRAQGGVLASLTLPV